MNHRRLFPRGLEDRLVAALNSAPVVILEGGRAVGKSTLCSQLKDAGAIAEIADLSDPVVRETAETDPVGFVRRLKLPVVIDEAQLVAPLTLAVKQRVDELGEAGLFLLTGSSRLGRDALGGSDPLAGRAIRLRLHPFTQAERSGNPITAVQTLRSGEFQEMEYPIPSGLPERLLLGGLPGLPGVLAGAALPSMTRGRLADYVDSVIRADPSEPRLDRARMSDVFRVLAGSPALILNQVTLARDLDMSPITLRNYLEVLKARFLINEIPALASDARREVKGHPRLVPFDVALAGWAARHSVASLQANPTLLGQLLHCLVVNELQAQLSWLAEDSDLFHWRYRDEEVDTVVRFADGELLGVEIKASRNVTIHDAKGLRSFRRRVRKDARGIVFYLGDRSYELEEGIWALPVQFLWEEGRKLKGKVHMAHLEIPVATSLAPASATEVPADSALFFSYVHADDEAEGGRIVGLAEDIGERYRMLTGEALEVFVDKKDLRWGDEWRARIDEQLSRTTFFLPVVTPRFLQSEECRKETLKFVAASGRVGAKYALPIFYFGPSLVDDTDAVGAALRRYHGWNWSELRYEERDSGVYRRAVDELCTELAKRVKETSVAAPPAVLPAVGVDDSERPDLLQRFENLEGVVADLPEQRDDYFEALNDALEAVNTASAGISGGASPKSARLAIRKFVEDVQVPVDRLEKATKKLSSSLALLDGELTALVRERDEDPDDLVGLGAMLGELQNSIPDGLGLTTGEVDQVRAQMRFMGRISKEMRGPTRVFERSILLISDLDEMLSRWRRDLA